MIATSRSAIALALGGWLMLAAGCASVLVNQSMQKRDAMHMQLLAGRDGQPVGATVGINLFSLPTAWDNLIPTGGALGTDILAFIATYKAAKQAGWLGNTAAAPVPVPITTYSFTGNNNVFNEMKP